MKILSVQSSQILTGYFMLKLKLSLRVLGKRHEAVWDDLQLQTPVLIKGSFRDPVFLYPRKMSPLSFNTCLDGLNGLEKNKTLWPWPEFETYISAVQVAFYCLSCPISPRSQ
jgi:hypothetical protein